MKKKRASGLQRIANAFGYSREGLIAVFKSEAAFRQELALCAVLVAITVFLPLERVEYVLLYASLVLLLIVELINTAIETVVERISTQTNSLSKKAKDIGSAAVLLAFILVLIVWGPILWQVAQR